MYKLWVYHMFKWLVGESHNFLDRRYRSPNKSLPTLFLLSGSKTFSNVHVGCLELRNGVLEEHLKVSLVPETGLWGWLEGCERIMLALFRFKSGKITHHRRVRRKSRILSRWCRWFHHSLHRAYPRQRHRQARFRSLMLGGLRSRHRQRCTSHPTQDEDPERRCGRYQRWRGSGGQQ